MTARGKVWASGLAVTAGAALWASRDASSRELVGPIAVLGTALVALAAEISSIARRPARIGLPEGARPADGVIDFMPMDGVEAEPNADSPRLRRFLGLVDQPDGAARVGRLATGRPMLLGRVALISVFVGRDGADWTDEEIARGHGALERAGAWIEREAIRYDVRVNLGLADAYFRVRDDSVDEVEVAFAPEGDDLGPMEADASTKAIVLASRAAASLGFADVVDLIGRVNPRVDADARVWLLHLRRSGRSLAIPADECEVAGVGLAVCYSREASFPGPLEGPGRVDPTTVAHELLHLFGASDKYGVALRSFPPGTVGPRDIMRLNHDRLSRLAIDALTASEVGWEPSRPDLLAKKNARR